MREERGSPEKAGTESGGGRGVPRCGDAASPDAPSFAAAAGPGVKRRDRESFVLS